MRSERGRGSSRRAVSNETSSRSSQSGRTKQFIVAEGLSKAQCDLVGRGMRSTPTRRGALRTECAIDKVGNGRHTLEAVGASRRAIVAGLLAIILVLGLF